MEEEEEHKLEFDHVLALFVEAEEASWRSGDHSILHNWDLGVQTESCDTLPNTILKHGSAVTNIHSYFSNLQSRKCCLNLASCQTTVHYVRHIGNDGVDSIADTWNTAECTLSGTPLLDHLGEKDHDVYSQALLCADYPILCAPQPPSVLSPMLPDYQRRTSRRGSLSNYDQDAIDSDDISTSVIPSESLCELLRRAFGLSRQKAARYERLVFEQYRKRKKSRDKALVEELANQLALLENNKHPFYNQRNFLTSDAYKLWKHKTRQQIGELITKFWQEDVPRLKGSQHSDTHHNHENYRHLMEKLLTFERSMRGERMQNLLSPVFSSASLRLLKEFGLRYGVGEVYRRSVYLAYLAEHFEIEPWYLKHTNHLLVTIIDSFPPNKNRAIMVREEWNLLKKSVGLLHRHCEHSLTRVKRLFPGQSPQEGVGCLIQLLANVLELDACLLDQHHVPVLEYLIRHTRTNVANDYNHHKMVALSDLKLDPFKPPTPKLLNRMMSCIRDEVQDYTMNYIQIYQRYFDVAALTAQSFYLLLMDDVKLLLKEARAVQLEGGFEMRMLSLAYRLNQLDKDWKAYIPISEQSWRELFSEEVMRWLSVLKLHTEQLMMQAVGSDHFMSLTVDESDVKFSPRPPSCQSASSFSITPSEGSAFDSVHSRVHSTQPESNSTTSKEPSLRDWLTDSMKQESIDPYLPRETTPFQSKGGLLTRVPDKEEVTETSFIRDEQASSYSSGSSHSYLFTESKDTTNTQPISEKERTSRNISNVEDGVDLVEQGKYIAGGQEEQVMDEDVSANREILLVPNIDTYSTSSGPDDNTTESVASDKTSTKNTEENEKKNSKEQMAMDEKHEYGELGEKKPGEPGKEEDRKSEKKGDDDQMYDGNITDAVLVVDESRDDPENLEKLRSISLDCQCQSLGSDIEEEKGVVKEEIINGKDENESLIINGKREVDEVEVETECTGGEMDGQFVRETASPSLHDTSSDSLHILSGIVPISGSLLDVLCIFRRVMDFGKVLSETVYPFKWPGGEEVSASSPSTSPTPSPEWRLDHPRGERNDKRAKYKLMQFKQGIVKTRLAVYKKIIQIVSSLVCLYAENLLCYDLCGTRDKEARQIAGQELIDGIKIAHQESRIWGCRHMAHGIQSCFIYVNRKSKHVNQRYENITEEMALRVNNLQSLLETLPQFQSELCDVLDYNKIQNQAYELGLAEPDELLEDFVVIDTIGQLYLPPVTQGNSVSPERSPTSDHSTSSSCSSASSNPINNESELVFGHCKLLIQQVQTALVDLMAYRLNLFFRDSFSQSLKLELPMVEVHVKLQPLSAFLDWHLSALRHWLYEDSYHTLVIRLWKYVGKTFMSEVVKLTKHNRRKSVPPEVLLRAIAYFMSYFRTKGLHESTLTQEVERPIYWLELHTCSTNHLINLYRVLFTHRVDQSRGKQTMLTVPMEFVQKMRTALHGESKCFTGSRFVNWILTEGVNNRLTNPGEDKDSNDMLADIEINENAAVELAQKLLDQGIIRTVEDTSPNPDQLAQPIPGKPYPDLSMDSYSLPRRILTVGSQMDMMGPIHSAPVSPYQQSGSSESSSEEGNLTSSGSSSGSPTGIYVVNALRPEDLPKDDNQKQQSFTRNNSDSSETGTPLSDDSGRFMPSPRSFYKFSSVCEENFLEEHAASQETSDVDNRDPTKGMDTHMIERIADMHQYYGVNPQLLLLILSKRERTDHQAKLFLKNLSEDTEEEANGWLPSSEGFFWCFNCRR